jgi:signal transduction histidine kinase
VVHGIVESFGASITVETKIGAGSTFRVFFPAVSQVNTAGDAMAAADA